MPAGKQTYPYASFRFRVELDGITAARFSDVSGLQVETETEPYEEGGVNDYVHQFPKRTRYQDVVSGRFVRKNGSVVLMNSAGEDKWRWNFFSAYPVKWTGPELKADSNTVAFETIELVHHGIQKG
jgi:hypothetical protein